MSRCRRCIVKGRVQGVWFRETTRRHAQSLGLTGYARNLPDGSVEVIACGSDNGLKQLASWLWQGSPSARVESVECEAFGLSSFSDFSTG